MVVARVILMGVLTVSLRNSIFSDEVILDATFSDAPGMVSEERDGSIKFFGPEFPLLADDSDNLPVQYTAPYFDCGRSNKWIFSAVAPVYDRLPRYVYDPQDKNNLTVGIYDNVRSNV
jgi:hypothetical protein